MTKEEFDSLKRGDWVEFENHIYESTGPHTNGTDIGIYDDLGNNLVPTYVPFDKCELVEEVSADLTLKDKFRIHLKNCNDIIYKDYIDSQFEADFMLFIEQIITPLRSFKEQQLLVTEPLLEFAQNSDLFKLGDSVHSKTVDLLKQLTELKGRRSEWISVEDTHKLPACYETGDWDGKRSEFQLVINRQGFHYEARLYLGHLDGSPFSDWYGRDDFDIIDVTYHRPLPETP